MHSSIVGRAVVFFFIFNTCLKRPTLVPLVFQDVAAGPFRWVDWVDVLPQQCAAPKRRCTPLSNAALRAIISLVPQVGGLVDVLPQLPDRAPPLPVHAAGGRHRKSKGSALSLP